MATIGDRHYVEIPGDRLHELPPLLLPALPQARRTSKTLQDATQLVEAEEMLPLSGADSAEQQSRKFDLALQLVQQYQVFVDHWRAGESILEWIRQCETTFEARPELRPLLKPDLWPHAGRSSFVTLLKDKAVDVEGIAPEEAVGLRLTFRQPPPLRYCSDQFLLYLNPNLAVSAYAVWARLTPEPVSSLPPERFTFQVCHV
ncbi:MAG: hypothetical protein HXY18_00320 [Bryobacteraceae bacterium]|nr:hypothetical protein [Bryobacteraceae bacterium]